MKVLLDEMLPVGVRELLPSHDVYTAAYVGSRRREIARARELVCDLLVGDNEYGSTAESLDAYSLQFAVTARRPHRTPEPPA